MALIDELRRKFPQFDDYSDAELIDAAAPAFGGSPQRAMRYFGVEQNEPGFKSSFKGALAATPVGVGRMLEDAGAETVGRGLRRWGERVQLENPSSVNSFSDFAESPWQGFKEFSGSAIGSTLPALVPYVGPAGRILGGLRAAGAATAIMAPQSYGDIRAEQERNGATDVPSAAMGAAAVAAIEQAGGIQGLLRRGMTQGARDFASSPLRTAARTGAKVSLQEGAEELAQQPIQQAAGGTDPFSRESLGETAFSGFAGAVGSIPFGVVGGARRGLQHRAYNQDYDAAAAENAARMAEGQAVDLTSPATPMLGYNPRRMVGYPDGSVGWEDQPTDWNMANMLRDTSTQLDPTREMDLIHGAGSPTSAFSMVNPSLPMPESLSDAVGVIQTLQSEQERGRAIIEGSPEHQALLAAQQILNERGLKFPLDEDRIPPPYTDEARRMRTGEAVANPQQMSTSVDSSQQESAAREDTSLPQTPLGAARKVFSDAGGKRGDWAKMLDGTDGDVNVLTQKIEARVNNPKTSSESAKRWAAVLDIIQPKENLNGIVPVQVGQLESPGQPGPAAREGVPTQAIQRVESGGQTGVVGADGGVSGLPDGQRQESQVALAKAVGGLSQKQKEYLNLRLGLGAIDEDAADAKIAEQMGVSRQRVLQLKKESQKRVAKALGLTPEQVQGDLQTMAAQRVQTADAPDAPVSRLDTTDLATTEEGTTPSMSVIDSPNQTRVMEDARTAKETREANAVLKAGEDTAGVQTVEEQKRDAEMEAKRQAQAAIERQKLVAEMLSHPEAKNAELDWNDSKSESAPKFQDLAPLAQAMLVADYRELVEGEAPWSQFEAMFRDFERQLETENAADTQTVAEQGGRQPRVAGVSPQAQSTPRSLPASAGVARQNETAQPAERSQAQAGDQAAAGKGVKPLSEITVKITAIEADTGREIVMNEKADVALREVDEQLEKAKALLECLGS